jgi:hypothetical protein
VTYRHVSRNVSLNFFKKTCFKYLTTGGTAVAQWLRYYATNQKVSVSIPDGVMELFINLIPSDRTMALGSTQPLTEMSTGIISWGVKASGE